MARRGKYRLQNMRSRWSQTIMKHETKMELNSNKHPPTSDLKNNENVIWIWELKKKQTESHSNQTEAHSNRSPHTPSKH